jgi:hypothetical protein
MNLAVILGVYLLGLACAIPGCVIPVAQQSTAPASATTSSAQSPDSAQAAPAPGGQTPNPTNQAKPSGAATAKRRHRKKAVPANCSTAPTDLNAAPGNSTDPTKPADATSNVTAALPPCPTPRKVVRNGGSEEPSIQLVGGATAEQTAQQRSIDELTAATNANLKRIEGHPLNPTQQDMRNQIRQFMDQSKTAIAAGDFERGHNLAMKAHLLSDELVKP